jgi:hypothetical protein
MNKTVVKNKPSGYASSQGGTYATVGFDPLNYKVSNPSGVQMIGSGIKGGAGGLSGTPLYRVGSMTGSGLGADIIGSVGGVLGGIVGTYVSGANPFVIAGASTAVGGVFKSIGEQIGLGHKGGAVIPQKYIDFVDRLIGNQKSLSEIKSAIMKFELSPELKTRLSKAVSSLLRSMSGGALSVAMPKVKLIRPRAGGTRSGSKVKPRMRVGPMSGSGGVFQPQVSAYGLAKF